MSIFTSFEPKKYNNPKFYRKQYYYTNIRKHNAELCSNCKHSRKEHVDTVCPVK